MNDDGPERLPWVDSENEVVSEDGEWTGSGVVFNDVE